MGTRGAHGSLGRVGEAPGLCSAGGEMEGRACGAGTGGLEGLRGDVRSDRCLNLSDRFRHLSLPGEKGKCRLAEAVPRNGVVGHCGTGCFRPLPRRRQCPRSARRRWGGAGCGPPREEACRYRSEPRGHNFLPPGTDFRLREVDMKRVDK